MINRLLKYGAILLVGGVGLGITQFAVTGASPTPRPLLRMVQCPFVPDGYFYLKGDPPEGFENFDHITLLVSTGGSRPPTDTRLHTSDEKSYKFTSLAKFITHSSGSGVDFEFETERIEGVSYKFKGKFITICVFAEQDIDPKKAVAEGQITKFKDGKEVATAQVQFTYSKSQRSRAN